MPNQPSSQNLLDHYQNCGRYFDDCDECQRCVAAIIAERSQLLDALKRLTDDYEDSRVYPADVLREARQLLTAATTAPAPSSAPSPKPQADRIGPRTD